MNLDDTALIALIQEKIAAEQANAAESKRLADVTEAANQLLIKERERDNRRTGQWAATVDRYANLGELVKELIGVIVADRLEREAGKSITREFNNTLSERVDDLEQGIYAILTRDLAEMRRSKDRLGQHIDRRKQLQIHYQNLEKLEEQAASYGPLETPLKILNAIEALRAKIAEIEEN